MATSASKIVELVKQLNARKVDPEELKQFINDHPGCIKDAGKEGRYSKFVGTESKALTHDPVDAVCPIGFGKRPEVQEEPACRDSHIEDDIKFSKIFKDDELHASVSLAPIDVKDNTISFSYKTNEGKILELEDDERLVSEIISVSGTLPPVLNIPALLKILCSVEISNLDMNTEIVLKYYHAGADFWQIQETVGLQVQEYDWCGYPTTAVLAEFKVFSLRKFAAIMRPRRTVFKLGSEQRIVTSYPDEAVKIEVTEGQSFSTYQRLTLKVMNPKHATELAQLYEVAFSDFACIESEPLGERVPCLITLRFLQRVDFEGNLVVLKKTNYKSNWIDITKTCKAQLNTEENSVEFCADTFSIFFAVWTNVTNAAQWVADRIFHSILVNRVMFHVYQKVREIPASSNPGNIILLAACTPYTVNEKLQKRYEGMISQESKIQKFECICSSPSRKRLKDEESVYVSVCGHYESRESEKLCFSSDGPMWQTIHAVRNIDCSSDDANSVFVTFKSASEQGDSEVLCKIHYQTEADRTQSSEGKGARSKTISREVKQTGTPVDSNEKRCYANAAFVREELQRSLMISDAPERDVETADKPQSHVLHAARDPLPAGAVFGATNALAQISPQPGSDVRYFYQQNTVIVNPPQDATPQVVDIPAEEKANIKRANEIKWKQTSMEDFDSSTRYKLSHLLEPNRTPSYWPHLAAQLRIDRLLVDRLRGKDEPVINLFNSYECTTEDPSIPTIYDACIAIERYDTLKHFKKFQEVEDDKAEDDRVEEIGAPQEA